MGSCLKRECGRAAGSQRDAKIRQLKQEGQGWYNVAGRQIKQLQQGMGQQGLRAQRAEERVDQLLQEGRSLEGMHKARMKRGQEQIESRDKEIRDRGIA